MIGQLVSWSGAGAVLIALVVLLAMVFAARVTAGGHDSSSRLFSGCLFGHAPRVWTRNDLGVTVLRCPECLQDLPILAHPAIKGPRHQQGWIAGQPKERARVTRADNVRKFEKPSER